MFLITLNDGASALTLGALVKNKPSKRDFMKLVENFDLNTSEDDGDEISVVEMEILDNVNEIKYLVHLDTLATWSANGNGKRDLSKLDD